MKKQTILKSFLLSILILSVHTQVHALSEITGILSSSGAATQKNSAVNTVPTSVATATPSNSALPSTISSPAASNGNNQLAGNVTGGSSSGGGTTNGGLTSTVSSGSSGEDGAKQNGLVLGVSNTSNTSNKPKTASFTSDGLAFVPESSRMAVTDEPSVENASMAQTEANINNENTGLMVGESGLSPNSTSIEERFGFESATWFWIIILGLVLLAVIAYRYMRSAGDDVNQIR